MRVATGGLAASDRITPESISTRIAPSSGLSTVHHQSDSGVRSSREIMDVPNGQRSVPVVAEVGYREVNEVEMILRERGHLRSSCPGLTRASTSLATLGQKAVDGRDKPGP